MRRRLYIALGLICVALGTVGIIVPGLPTTPLLLAASWFFYRSSPRLREWLLDSKLGIYIRNYEHLGGMRRTTKVGVVVLMCSVVCCSIIFFIHKSLLDWIVGIAGVIGSLVVIFKVPNARKKG